MAQVSQFPKSVDPDLVRWFGSNPGISRNVVLVPKTECEPVAAESMNPSFEQLTLLPAPDPTIAARNLETYSRLDREIGAQLGVRPHWLQYLGNFIVQANARQVEQLARLEGVERISLSGGDPIGSLHDLPFFK